MFTTSKSALGTALTFAREAVEKRNTIPILANVAIEASPEPGKLSARATDLDVEIALTFAADIGPDFRPFTVPVGTLFDIVRKLADKAEIAFAAAGSGADADLSAITVQSGRARFRLPVLPVTDFPDLKPGDMPFSIDVKPAALAAALGAVRFAVSTEETRYYLNGVFMHPCDAGVLLVATDGHRLAKRLLRTDASTAGLPAIIVPRKTVDILGKILPKEGSITLSASDAKIRIAADGVELTSKLIDGTFPDYVRVIPAAQSQRAEIDSKALADAIDRVTTISTERGRAVRFTFADGRLLLTTSNPDAGEAEDEVPAEGEAQITIGFNGRYVHDALGNLPAGRLALTLEDAGSPTILRAVGADPEDLVVMMPMRV